MILKKILSKRNYFVTRTTSAVQFSYNAHTLDIHSRARDTLGRDLGSNFTILFSMWNQICETFLFPFTMCVKHCSTQKVKKNN